MVARTRGNILISEGMVELKKKNRMNLKKYFLMGGVVLSLGLTSCVGDLDLKPNDPNIVDKNNPNYITNSLGMCYSGIAVSGISGPGSSYVSDIDPGTSAYLRVLFTLNEFCTDECIWIWSDAGVPDITACTWSSNNGLINGAYFRFMGHVSICNEFLSNTADNADPEVQEMRAEARVLRAYSYYNMMDLFGQSSFITEEAGIGEAPTQISRADLFAWLETELKDVVDNNLISKTPVYGRVGLDGAEALLARLYLNAEVFTGTGRWADCQKRCENIIERHKGGGFNGSGLAKHYLYLFQRDNDAYMPGGAKSDENEILFGIAFDDVNTQSYGGPSFVISSTISNTHYMPRDFYGCSAEWSCLRGRKEMAAKFDGYSSDVRDDLWMKGTFSGGEENGVKWDSEDYSDTFKGFTGDWKTTGGNAIVKFTGRTRNAAEDGGWDMSINPDGTYKYGFPATPFAGTDQPIIRLADVYMMYTECYVHGNVGAQNKALQYMNYVRERAGAGPADASSLTKEEIMNERSREFYLEMTRRSDLIRNGMFAGPAQITWQYKGNIDNNEGTRIADHRVLYPIPDAVRSAQPDFKQNPGY